jgi:hypothetical protein
MDTPHRHTLLATLNRGPACPALLLVLALFGVNPVESSSLRAPYAPSTTVDWLRLIETADPMVWAHRSLAHRRQEAVTTAARIERMESAITPFAALAPRTFFGFAAQYLAATRLQHRQHMVDIETEARSAVRRQTQRPLALRQTYISEFADLIRTTLQVSHHRGQLLVLFTPPGFGMPGVSSMDITEEVLQAHRLARHQRSLIDYPGCSNNRLMRGQ